MKTIGIIPQLKSPGLRRTLDCMGEVLGVRFEERTSLDDSGIDAWLLAEASPQTLLAMDHCRLPFYLVLPDNQTVSCGESPRVSFSRHDVLPTVISGRHIEIDKANGLKGLPQWLQNTTALASNGGTPFWAVQKAGDHHNHFVALPIPEMNDGEALFQYFYGEQFLSLLPLLVFLRVLTDEQRWEPPPLQACFMFDDPNLHWRTYGYIDFAEMMRHARLHNYHASFATIPLDAWYVHLQTAHFFKENREHLSLLIHGNDHVAEEMGQDYSEEERFGILQQALIRIGKLERRSGVEVSRVMSPPHGACREEFLGTMSLFGLEAACVSKWSLRNYNSRSTWVRTFGMRPSDVVAGLTVIPRLRMSSNCHNNILVAALLHQPIIPMGHHDSLSEGFDLLGNLSAFVNSLGSVKWTDMKRISRSNYARRHDGNILRLRMFTKRIEILVPEGIRQLLVERAWLKGTEYEPLAWRVPGGKMEWIFVRPEESFSVLPGQLIEILSGPSNPPCMNAESIRKLHLWPVIRRVLTEARDRITPAPRRFSGKAIPSGMMARRNILS